MVATPNRAASADSDGNGTGLSGGVVLARTNFRSKFDGNEPVQRDARSSRGPPANNPAQEVGDIDFLRRPSRWRASRHA
ncbi:hypothetical protein, partial [Kitasatospora sp. NPDC059462]|uniref:hypothetical protein n=1 Tax=Kitasatospora sp. NPDC059462 TaxID=3346841 RepID=UPI00369DC06C